MRLDIGCGPNKKDGYVGLDNKEGEGVDVVHDLEDIPYPFEDDSFTHINASHILEHIKPWKIMEVMDELWRVAQKGAEIDIRTPYGDYFRFDPTHCIHFIAPSWLYFDPADPLYECYRPKPWKVMKIEDTADIKELHAILAKMSTGLRVKEEKDGVSQ